MSTPIYSTKVFRSLDEQIVLLRDRNLIIRDEEKAKRHLLEKNYFDLINGFETLFLKKANAKYKDYTGYYFEDFLLLYKFDKKLNLIILEQLDKFEIQLKTSMAFRFCEKYFKTPTDSDCYMDKNNYSDPGNNHLSLPKGISKSLGKHKIFSVHHKYGNFMEQCKVKYPYMSTYDKPPFWIVIKVLELGATFKLLLGFEKDVFEKVIKDMGMKYVDKQKFINSIRICIELRNTCAHFQLVNRFRTPKNLKIDTGLINDLGLSTKKNITGQQTFYEIRLFDSLLVLSQFENLSSISFLVKDFYFNHCNTKRERVLFLNMLERMGRKKLLDWQIFK